MAQWAKWLFLCLGFLPKLSQKSLFSPLANPLHRFQLGRLGNPPTSSPRSPPPSSPAMPTPVAASRISTWVFSTKIYTNKFIFVTKLGLGLVRVLLKEVSLPYHSTSTTAWIEHLILDLIIMLVYFVFMSLECAELPCQLQNRSHW